MFGFMNLCSYWFDLFPRGVPQKQYNCRAGFERKRFQFDPSVGLLMVREDPGVPFILINPEIQTPFSQALVFPSKTQSKTLTLHRIFLLRNLSTFFLFQNVDTTKIAESANSFDFFPFKLFFLGVNTGLFFSKKFSVRNFTLEVED